MGRKKSAHAFKRSISEENISKAFMITVLSAGILCVATFLMCVFEPEYDFIQIIFEDVYKRQIHGMERLHCTMRY